MTLTARLDIPAYNDYDVWIVTGNSNNGKKRTI